MNLNDLIMAKQLIRMGYFFCTAPLTAVSCSFRHFSDC